MSLIDKLFQKLTCRSGLHIYSAFEPERAELCCNGYTPVAVPVGMTERLDEWLQMEVGLEHHFPGFTVMLIPSDRTELIERLRNKIPAWYWNQPEDVQ